MEELTVGDIKKKCVSQAKRLVREKFPEMAGVEPSLKKKRAVGKGIGRKSDGPNGTSTAHYVVTFEKDVSLPGGGSLKRMVRVTVDETGEVVKLTSSK
jgi:hypothetical protein